MATPKPPGMPGPENVSKPNITSPITEGEPKQPQETAKPFKSYMEGTPNPLLTAGKNPQVSPFDLAHGKVPAPGPTLNTIQEQAKMASTTLGDLSNQLNTPKLKLKQSTKYLLKNKLGSAQKNLLSANKKMGAKELLEKENERPIKGEGPLQKYVALVNNGQYLLDSAQRHLADLSAKGQDIRPADMLSIQIKLSKAQQQLEFSSMLLSKAVSDMKMMMNIQL